MKIILPQEMARVEQLAYDAGAEEEVFMEAAGRAVGGVAQRFDGPKTVTLLCGKGNNGGDAYVAGRFLLEKGYVVAAIQVGEMGPLCKRMSDRFFSAGGKQTAIFPDEGFIIDGLFGTGFQGKAEGEFLESIERANASGLPILSVDIPSGLDGTTGEVRGSAIQATITVYLGMAKQGFFLLDGPNCTGKLIGREFGLAQEFIDQADATGELLRHSDVGPLLPKMRRDRHKYEAGYLVAVGGSPGMPGAPLLATTAAMRSGAGMVRLLHPKGMASELAVAPYELIRESYESADELLRALQKASAVLVGPGLGRTKKTKDLLCEFLPKVQLPLLLDADALLPDVTPPKGAILTPHLGEMQRLLGSDHKLIRSMDLLHICQEYVEKHEITLVLKGAITYIFHPGTLPLVSDRGDPGMATAGSGDVLSGIVASFLAQGCPPRDAASLGCFLHGLAGEIAAGEMTSHALIASDLIEALPEAIEAISLV